MAKGQKVESEKSVALIFQPMLMEARRLADQCLRIVETAGYTPRLQSAWELGPSVSSEGVRLAITFGGDGTIIRAARWLAGTGVPILGVAMGKLGFLTEMQPDVVRDRLPSVLAGDYWVDERSMLAARVESGQQPDGAPASPLIALNDVVIARGASPRVAQIEVQVDGVPLVKYVADGLVVATPTGSTAYALSAGGPVVAPGVQGVLIVPVAAHLAVLRSMLVPVSARIEVRASADQPTLLVMDGQVQIPLKNNQPVTVEMAKERTLFARTGTPSRFYETLVESLKRR